MMDFKDKRVLVLGMGSSGQAAASLLVDKGAIVSVSDTSGDAGIRNRFINAVGSGIRMETGGHTSSFCNDADIIVTSPGIDVSDLYPKGILSRDIPVISELELGYYFCPSPIIAITGTNGKTTTTKLIGDIFSHSGRHTVVCGNIGNPLSGEVMSLTEKSIAVVEVSSFQLEGIKEFRPHVAVLLNVSEDHYDRHGNYDKYRREKFNIFRNQGPGDWAVLNVDFSGKDPHGRYIDPLVRNINSRLLFFGTPSSHATVSDRGIAVDLPGFSEVKIDNDEIPLKGVHNLYNVSCAVLVSSVLGVDRDVICETVKNFRGLAHRFEKVLNINGVDFIDDSKATNIDATRKALESVAGKVVLIAGGIDKGGDYLSVLPLIKEKVKAMVLIGASADKISSTFSGVVDVSLAAGMAEAVDISAALASPGETVLLSPMCSSFDMFSSYKERGEVFRKEVLKLSVDEG